MQLASKILSWLKMIYLQKCISSFNLLYVYATTRTGKILLLYSEGWNFPSPGIWLGNEKERHENTKMYLCCHYNSSLMI